MTTLKLINQLKDSDQDFEFYPTTDEIIASVAKDIDHLKHNSHRHFSDLNSLLDIGAGNGKVLMALKERCEIHDLYAIEKSPALCGVLPASVFIVGTDFMEQSLLAKTMDMTFCNPPYSEFVAWAVKIIRESASRLVYLVVPTRWEGASEIKDALTYRSAEAHVCGTYSFENAEDRAARAKVNLIRVQFQNHGSDDAFERFFESAFGDLKAKFTGKKKREDDEEQRRRDPDDETKSKFGHLVVGPSYPEAMVNLYNQEMDRIRANYEAVSKLDPDLMREFDVSPDRVMKCLKDRLAGTRNIYWNELIGNMSAVTDRLCSKQRRDILSRLQTSGHVDFTLGNIHVIIMWVLKNANDSMEDQLLAMFDDMVTKANVRNYKSNERVFTYDRWRYSEEKPSHIALEYRIVLDRCGGVTKCNYNGGLEEHGANFLNDIMTVARNLGFFCTTNDRRLAYSGRKEWESGQLNVFHCQVDGEHEPLMEVRAFYNRNIHVRLNQKFALALNVEVGRLRGWLHDGADAASELMDKNAAKYFGAHVRLGTGSLPMLGGSSPVQPPVGAALSDMDELPLEVAQ